MDYGSILSRAWKITWNNKILWLFGFLAGGGVSFNFRSSTNLNGGNGGFTGEPGDVRVPREIQRLLERPEAVAVIVAVAVLLIVLAITFFILSIIARGSLIGGIRLADDKGQVTFREAWAIGQRYFWRTLGMTLALIVPALVFGVAAAAIALATFGFGVVCILPLLCVFVIAYIPYSAVVWLGQIGVVVDDLKVFDGIQKGWQLLQTNIGPVIIIGVILIVIGLVIGFALLLPLIVLVLPVIFTIAAEPRNPNVPLIVGSIAALLCFLPVLWVLSGMLNTWVYSVWTLAYRELTGNRPAPLPPVSDVMQPA